MSAIMIGLDTAKAVFHVHGVDAGGAAQLRRTLRRRVVAFFAAQPSCTVICCTNTEVVLEACGAAHHWGHVLTGLGHTVR